MNNDYDETARIILMESPPPILTTFANQMKEQHPELRGVNGIRTLSDIWLKYRGWDGRTYPTHDIITGLPRR